MRDKKISVRRLTVTAMLSAVAFLLQLIEVPTPLTPPFLKMDLSDIPALLGTFAFGPVTGCVIELVKNLLHVVLKGTMSACVGEVCNAAFGVVFCAVAGGIYRVRRTRRGAILACLAGTLAMGIASLPINYFAVYPAYESVYGMAMDQIIAAYTAILPAAATNPTGNALFNCLLIFNVPFTIVKGLLCCAVVMLIYKPLSPILKNEKGKSK